VVTVRLLHGHERSGRAARAEDDAAVLAVGERYSVDELQAIAMLRGRNEFPGVPAELRLTAEHDRAVVNDVVLRSLVARGVVDARTRNPLAPHLTLFTVALDAPVTCSVQRHRPYEVGARNAFVLEGLLVDQHSPHPHVVELAACDARAFGAWLGQATGWSAAARMHTELRQIARSVQKLRNLFGALAAEVPTTLEDQQVIDAGRVVTYRRSGAGVAGVDLGWVTTVETVWAFPNASEVLGGFAPANTDVTLQATTEAELTRAVLRSIRPVAVPS
jgi:hypothetical protein